MTVALHGVPVAPDFKLDRVRTAPPGVVEYRPGPEPEWVPDVCLLGAGACVPATPLHQLYTEAVQQGRQEQLIQIVQTVLPGSKRIEILTEGDSPVLHVVYPNRSVPVEFAGDGVHALLRMSMEIARPPGALVLIEEPEIHQHPGGMRQAIRAILAAVRQAVQVVLTTHSLEFIDILLGESTDDDLNKLALFRLKLKDGELLSARLPGPEVARVRHEIEDDLR